MDTGNLEVGELVAGGLAVQVDQGTNVEIPLRSSVGLKRVDVQS
jgi:hypothetical protein